MPADEKRRRDREVAEIAALADGSLPAARRAALERRIAASPRLQALLREQQAALAAVRARDERAPRRLRESIAASRAARPARARILRPRVAVAAAAVAAVAAVVVLALPDSDAGLPTLAQAASVAARPPSSAQPSAGAWGIEYPDLARVGGWRAVGSRTDRLGDRTARTVFYVKGERRIAYTILSAGAGPDRPRHAHLAAQRPAVVRLRGGWTRGRGLGSQRPHVRGLSERAGRPRPGPADHALTAARRAGRFVHGIGVAKLSRRRASGPGTGGW